MYRLLLVLFILMQTAPQTWAQSVADAARATRERQQSSAPKKVITDEDLPSTSTASNGDSVSLGADWEADIERFRATYKQICSSSGSSGSLTAQQKQQIEEATQPLKARMEQEKQALAEVKAEVEKMKSEEQAELAAAGTDASRRAEIRTRYAEFAKPKQALVAASLQRAAKVFDEVMNVATQCMQPR